MYSYRSWESRIPADLLFCIGICYNQEKLYYKIKYLSEKANNTRTNYIRLGFSFHNSDLDNALRERSSLDNFLTIAFSVSSSIFFPRMYRSSAQPLPTSRSSSSYLRSICRSTASADNWRMSSSATWVWCVFKVDHDPTDLEHMIRIIFHMPCVWNSPLEVALVDPVRAPKISLSYPEDIMQVDMFSFLSKGEESSLEVAHEQLNGIYDIALSIDWVYPISGMIFTVNRKA